MFKRYWIVAFFLGLSATQLHAQEQIQGSHGESRDNNEKAEAPTFGFPVKIIEDYEASRARESREAESNQREKDDLIAQQRMADATVAMDKATQSMKNASWWSFGAVAVGTVLLIWTLWLTRKANAAAMAGVVVTQEVGRKQLRAYLFPASVKVDTSNPELVADIEIHNFGHTPAKDAVIWCHTWIDEYPLGGDLIEPTHESAEEFSRADMPPRYSYHFKQPHGAPLGFHSITEIEKKRAAFYVYGRATYTDIFGEYRFSNFLFFYNGNISNWDGRVMPYRNGNDSN